MNLMPSIFLMALCCAVRRYWLGVAEHRKDLAGVQRVVQSQPLAAVVERHYNLKRPVESQSSTESSENRSSSGRSSSRGENSSPAVFMSPVSRLMFLFFVYVFVLFCFRFF